MAEGFQGGKKTGPDGWVLKPKPGQLNKFTAPYDKNINWSVSALKTKSGTGGNFSLYFGNNGTFNTGTTTPAATADSPAFKLQGSSKSNHMVSFDLFLDTEWSNFAFKKPTTGIVIDQFVVSARDVDAKKVQWWPIFDSYDI